MPEYLSPGVYVEEVDTGSKPIEGVSTSTSAMVGVTERGPVNVPIMVTSTGQYARIFGGRLNHIFYPQPHNYIPHAVEGFFTNEGQRLYVVRVLDVAAAQHARTSLYDRGTPLSANSRLLRDVNIGAGTAAAGPSVYVLDGSNLAVNDWVRAGDGSRAEYRQVAVIPAGQNHVPLDMPLLRQHGVGAPAADFSRAAIASFTLTADVAPGDTAMQLVEGAAGDAAALVTAVAAGQVLVEVGPMNQGEYRFVVDAVLDATTTMADLTLDVPVVLGHDLGDAVTSLDFPPTAVPNESDQLETAANVGDRVIFVDDRGGEFDLTTRYVLIDGPDPAAREVRRVGLLGELSLASAPYEEYAGGSIVQRVTMTDAAEVARNITADPAQFDTTIAVDDVTGWEPGDVLRVGAVGTQEDMVIQAIVPGVAPAGDVTFTGQLQIDHGLDAVQRLSAFSLTADAAAGSRVVELSGRLDILAAGANIHGETPTRAAQVLRIGGAPDDEYVNIDDLTNPSPTAPPDPGAVVLATPLQHAHAEGTLVFVQEAPALVAAQPSATVFASEEGDDAIWITDGTAYAAGQWIRITNPRADVFFHRITAVGAASVTQFEVQNPPFQRAHVMGVPLVERAELLGIEALDAGIWGDRLRVSTDDEPQGLVENTQLRAVNVTSATDVRLDSALGVEAGTVLEFSDALGATVGGLVKVDGIDRRTGDIQLAAPGLDAAQLAELGLNGSLSVRSREFMLTVRLLRQPDPAVPSRNTNVLDSEEFRYLSMDPRHGQYFQDVLGEINGPLRLWDRRPEGQSQYIRVADVAASQAVRLGPELLRDVLPNGQTEPARRALGGGHDSIGTLSYADHYVGHDAAEPELRTGIQSLRNEEDVSLVCSPGLVNEDVQRGLIEHCESMRYRFAVLDGPDPAADTLADAQAQRQRYDSKYAALYYPWALVTDPYPRSLADVRTFPVPPSGHMMGLYARTDVERGVHKAPANEVVRGIRGLRRLINKREHDLLNPRNINVIRDFRLNNRGIRAWGARVITSDSDWKYVNVRRLLIFIEHSIERGTQWVVFEPNAEPLWARVRRTIRNFLTVVWRDGALEGTTTEEAFFVRCDRTTMTQADIDNGRLICEIGVAPVKPAEFVIFRIGLWTAHGEE